MVRSLRLAFFAVLLSLAGSVVSAAPEPVAPAFAISEIQIKLFYANSGRFSSNLAEKKDLVLWNVIIGEGSGVEGPSENTLLIVTVSGAPKVAATNVRLRVQARTEKKVLLQHQCEVGTLNSSGNWYAPFLLYDTGCEPVIVTAHLLPNSGKPPVSFTIPFSCGE